MKRIYAAIMIGETPIATFQPWDSEMTYPMFQERMLAILADLAKEGFGPLSQYQGRLFRLRLNPLARHQFNRERVIEEAELENLPVITEPRYKEKIVKAFLAQVIQAS